MATALTLKSTVLTTSLSGGIDSNTTSNYSNGSYSINIQNLTTIANGTGSLAASQTSTITGSLASGANQIFNMMAMASSCAGQTVVYTKPKIVMAQITSSNAGDMLAIGNYNGTATANEVWGLFGGSNACVNVTAGAIVVICTPGANGTAVANNSRSFSVVNTGATTANFSLTIVGEGTNS